MAIFNSKLLNYQRVYFIIVFTYSLNFAHQSQGGDYHAVWLHH